MSKYKNKKVVIDEITFDSKAEARFYEENKHNKRMKIQVKFELLQKFKCGKKSYRNISYIPDFVFYDEQGNIEKVVDVKGYVTPVFKLKAKLFMARYNAPIILAKYYVRKNLWIETQA